MAFLLQAQEGRSTEGVERKSLLLKKMNSRHMAKILWNLHWIHIVAGAAEGVLAVHLRKENNRLWIYS